MTGPLSGRRILEVGHMLAGPYCGMLLSDLGAEVIKIEGSEGDIGRGIGPNYVDGHNTYFASLNRGKKSVVLDLAAPEGQAALRRLARDADGLITNLRPAAIRKLGLTYDALREVNPRLACVALTGYGLTGPFAESPAYDYVIQALTGVMLLTGDPDGPPVKPGFSTVDNSAGIMGALALTAKLAEGRGGQADVSMHDVMLSQLNYLASAYLNAGEVPARIRDGGHPYIVPAQLFPTARGHIVLFLSHDRFWRIFAEAVGEPGWVTDPRFATMSARARHRQAVIDLVAARLAERDAETWVETLAPLGLVVAAVQSLPDALDGPLTASRGMVIEIPVNAERLRLVASPIVNQGAEPDYRPPPRLGEHDALAAAPGTGAPAPEAPNPSFD